MIDATIVRAHQHGAEAQKDGAQAIGRSRDGLTTKIDALVDAPGNPVEAIPSPGRDHDLTCAQPLIQAVDPGALIADKAFDADAFIPSSTVERSSRSSHPDPTGKLRRDFALYREGNLVEPFFNKLKHFRAIATRDDTLAKIFLAGIHFARAAILLN